VAAGSRSDGVKMSVVSPFQRKVPATVGVMLNRRSTVPVLTGSLKRTSIAVSVWPTLASPAGALRVNALTLGGWRSTSVALYRTTATVPRRTSGRPTRNAIRLALVRTAAPAAPSDRSHHGAGR